MKTKDSIRLVFHLNLGMLDQKQMQNRQIQILSQILTKLM
jgi:hypothetical protein